MLSARVVDADGHPIQQAHVMAMGIEKTGAYRFSGPCGNPRVDFLVADLSVQSEIRRVAAEVQERYAQLHVLVNNVGGIFINGQVSADGIEMTLALNHLGTYLLTRAHLLFESSTPSRIVNVFRWRTSARGSTIRTSVRRVEVKR
jgi:NAD(P)-dependent dehydrogenase (short-subunit alcohol dehydrogenase family)